MKILLQVIIHDKPFTGPSWKPASYQKLSPISLWSKDVLVPGDAKSVKEWVKIVLGLVVSRFQIQAGDFQNEMPTSERYLEKFYPTFNSWQAEKLILIK